MTVRLQNISVVQFKTFIQHHGLKHIRTSSGHEIWSRPDLRRPVTFQTHIDPIPLFIIKNNLRTMGLTTKELREFLTG